MDDKDSSASGSQTRPDESASESQAEPEDVGELLKQMRGLMTTLKTIQPKNNFKFDAVETRKFLMTKLRSRDVVFLCLIGIKAGYRIDNKQFPLTLGYTRLPFRTIKRKAEIGNTLTFTRVMTCFPEITVALASKTSLWMTLPFEKLQAIHADFPRIARTQVAAAIVPRTLKTEEKRLALALMVVSSLLTSESEMSSDFRAHLNNGFEQDVEQVFQYVVKSFKSKVLSDEMRMEYALWFGVVDTDGALSPAWIAAGMASTAWLKDEYYGYDISLSPENFYESS